MKIVNDNNMNASVKVCVVTIKNWKNTAKANKPNSGNHGDEKAERSVTSEFQNGSQIARKQTENQRDLLNTSSSVKPRQCFTNYSRAASRSAGGQSVCWVCARRAWLFPRANCSCTATCRLGGRPHYKRRHRLTWSGSAPREVAGQRRPCQPRGEGSTTPLFSLPFLLMEGRRCSH